MKIENGKVKREKEINDIITEISLHNEQRKILYICGEHHVGKSTLRKQLENCLSQRTGLLDPVSQVFHTINYITYDFRISQNSSEFDTINSLYKLISTKYPDIQFPRYELGRLYLYHQYGMVSEKYAFEENDWTDIFKSIIKSMKKLAQTTVSPESESAIILNNPVSDFIIDQSTSFFAKKMNSAKKFLERKFKGITIPQLAEDIESILSDSPADQIEKKLTEYFLLDLEAFSKMTLSTNIIILDTFEICSKRNLKEQWFYSKLIRASESITWIIFGTEKNVFRNVHDEVRYSLVPAPYFDDTECVWEKYTKENIWKMKRFDNNTSYNFLTNRIPEATATLINKFIDLSQNHPGALGILLDAYKKNNLKAISDLDFSYESEDFYPEIFKIYFQNSDEIERSILYFLSAFDVWTKEIFMFFANQNHIPTPEKYFISITELSFIQKYSNTEFFIIDLARNALQSNCDKEEWHNNLKAGYEYYKTRSDDLLEQWMNSQNWDLNLYEELKTASIKAIEYGIKFYDTDDEFNAFSQWFVKDANNVVGFEQKLSRPNIQLYDLKKVLLTKYTSKIERKDSFSCSNGQIYKLQAYYDLLWAFIYLHDYSNAITACSQRLEIGLLECSVTDEEIIKCIYSLGVIYQRWGRYEDAEFWHTVALKQRKLNSVTTEQKDYEKSIRLVAISLNTLADAKMNNLKNENRFFEARKLFKKALKIKKSLYQNCISDEQKSKAKKDIVATINNISKLYFLWGHEEKNIEKIEKAKNKNQKCIEILSEIGVNKNNLTQYEIREAVADFELKRIENTIDKETAKLFIAKFEKYEKIWSADNANKTDFTHYLLNTHINMGVIYAYAEDFDKARELLEESVNDNMRSGLSNNFQYEKNAQIAMKNLHILELIQSQNQKGYLKDLTLIY